MTDTTWRHRLVQQTEQQQQQLELDKNSGEGEEGVRTSLQLKTEIPFK